MIFALLTFKSLFAKKLIIPSNYLYYSIHFHLRVFHELIVSFKIFIDKWLKIDFKIFINLIIIHEN